MIFHEYGHAYFARTFAKNSFFPMIVYAATVEDTIVENGVRHMWNGLCDCYVNELVLGKGGVEEIRPNFGRDCGEDIRGTSIRNVFSSL
jgi:hypothetical protein